MYTLKNNIKFIIDPLASKLYPPKLTYQQKWGIQPNESLPIEIARGCLYNCKFCTYAKKATYRKPLATLRDEFIRNYELFGTTTYQFCDDCFNDTRQKVEETCNTILQLPFKINWVSHARLDVAIKFPETLDLMIESGAKGLAWGVETLNYEAAKMAGKGVSREKVKEMLATTYNKNHDKCLYYATFIIGLPGETEESQLETIEWLTTNKCLDFASFGVLGIPSKIADSVVGMSSPYGDNPEKYGLDLSNGSYNWQHQTMNRATAEKLLPIVYNKWLDSENKTFLRNVWFVPFLFSMGFGWNNIKDMGRNENNSDKWRKEVNVKFQSWLQNYWASLLVQQKPHGK
ncbi:MAG: radical SAM protein [Richelia sp. RM2_1_2]|nr:radical SAM protein [Richelia sp. RM2_1_2]